MRLPSSDRAREELRRLTQHPHARYWGFAIGALVVVLAILVVLLSIQDTTTIEQYVSEQWKTAMESQDSETYATLWDGSARDEWKLDFETARNLVGRQRLEVHLEGIRAVTDPVDSNAFLVQAIPVTFERDGEQETTHHTIRMAPRGLRRRWKLISHNITFPQPKQPIVTQAVPNPVGVQQGDTPSTEAAPELVQLPASGDAPLDTHLKLSQIVEAWRTSWEQQRVEDYLSWYAKEADIVRIMVIKGKEYPRKLRKDQLRKHMERLNRKYSKIQVKLANLEINGDNAVAEVNFLQEFAAWKEGSSAKPAYRDLGTKRLKFMIDPGDGSWKIYQERWKIYRDVPYKL